MVVYAFYVFDRHSACIYKKKWNPRPPSSSASTQQQQQQRPSSSSGGPAGEPRDPAQPPVAVERAARALSAEDDAKLVFGAVYSLRNMVRRLGGEDDAFVSFRTGEYKLHYYETPTSLKFVMLTDTRTSNLRIVLHQIYVGLFVEYVVKNPLSPVEHGAGEGVANEMFEMGLETFISGALQG